MPQETRPSALSEADSPTDDYWMEQALALARQAGLAGEVPVGALVILGGRQIAGARNEMIGTRDPTAHAEVSALRKAALRLQNYRLPECELFVTLEPCAMCAGALVHARIKRLVFGAREPRSGAVVSQFRLLESSAMNHKVQVVGGVLADACSQLLLDFFAGRRTGAKHQKGEAS